MPSEKGASMTKEALKLALKALEIGLLLIEDFGSTEQLNAQHKAITAIYEALAQPEPNYKKALEMWLDKTEWVQETVKPQELGMHRADVLKQRIEAALAQTEHGWTPERIAGMARLKEAQDKKLAESEQEPVGEIVDAIEGAFKCSFTKMLPVGTKLYTTPPQRKPLTDEEIETYRYMIDWTAHWSYINFARAIEAAHGIKEKNT